MERYNLQFCVCIRNFVWASVKEIRDRDVSRAQSTWKSVDYAAATWSSQEYPVRRITSFRSVDGCTDVLLPEQTSRDKALVLKSVQIIFWGELSSTNLI